MIAQEKHVLRTHDMRVQVPCDHHIQSLGDFCHHRCSDLRCGVCPDTGLENGQCGFGACPVEVEYRHT